MCIQFAEHLSRARHPNFQQLCTELLGYTQLTQYIDKSRFITSLALRCYIELFQKNLSDYRQALPFHLSILRLLNVTSGKNNGHEIAVSYMHVHKNVEWTLWTASSITNFQNSSSIITMFIFYFGFRLTCLVCKDMWRNSYFKNASSLIKCHTT